MTDGQTLTIRPHSPATTVEEALRTRRSVRAFLPTQIPRPQIDRLLSLAACSPSNSNTQPWHVHILTGQAKIRLGDALLDAFENGRRLSEAELEYPYQPEPDAWSEPFRSRRRRFGEELYREVLGIDPGDTATRAVYHARNYRFFDAPVGLIITVGRNSQAGALVDAGLFLQAFMVAARGSGLDTCPQASFLYFHPIIREELGIPDDQVIVCGLALGYADPDHVLSTYRTDRESLESFTTFHQ